jgi:hypothetical protein
MHRRKDLCVAECMKLKCDLHGASPFTALYVFKGHGVKGPPLLPETPVAAIHSCEANANRFMHSPQTKHAQHAKHLPPLKL